MKAAIILVVGLLLSILSSAKQASSPIVVDNSVCLKRGQITHGTLLSPINIERVKSEPLESGECAHDAILLKPGVLVDGQMVSPKGYCLTDGVLIAGMAQSIGDTIEMGGKLPSGKECSINAGFGTGVSLSKGVILDIFPENTPANQVFTTRDSPLLDDLIYTTQILTDTVCLDGGIILDGLIKIKNWSPISNEECAQSSAQIQKGVVDGATNKVFTTAKQCLVDGVIGFGRVLVNSGRIVKLGELLSSGKTCSLAGIDPSTASGVVLRMGVVLIIPDKSDKSVRETSKDNKIESQADVESNIESKDIKNTLDVVDVAQNEAKKPSISNKGKPKKGKCKNRKKDKGRKVVDGLSQSKTEEKGSN